MQAVRPIQRLLLPLALTSIAVAQDGPGPVTPDVFHPDVEAGDEPAGKAYGGRIIVHLESMPANMNRVIENSAVARWLQYAAHDTLLCQDWENWDLEPRACTRYDVEDQLILMPGAAAKYGDAVVHVKRGELDRQMLYGEVRETDGGYRVVPLSKGSALPEAIEVAAEDVEALERGTVFTFHVREGVTWHDGHPLDARDVYFTWEAYQNPDVDCDDTRSNYNKLIHAEIIDPMTVRIFYRSQYYGALEDVGEMPLLASHVYDLHDPDCAAFDPDATEPERAKHVNENEANYTFIGLGAYRVTTWDPQYVEMERYDDYWAKNDPRYGGYLDVIRFRYIADDNTAFQAILNGELDLFVRVTSEDYFGEATEASEFTGEYYKGYVYTGNYGYLGWNLTKPQFADPNVRKALAHAFDMADYVKTKYRGLGRWVTGPPNSNSTAYDRTLPGPQYDPDLAEELLAEAGWYDRDGDDVIDKDGIPFEFEFLFPTGNEASQSFGLKYQEALARLGIKLNMANLEWATFLERVLDRDFDTVQLAWQPDVESDPEQVWHSKWGKPGLRSSNFVSYQDEETDRLIEAIQIELDHDRRMQQWHALHRRVASLQPYLFMVCAPRKFAMAKRFRGFKTSAIAPGYNLREVYLPVGTPGTRLKPERN